MRVSPQLPPPRRRRWLRRLCCATAVVVLAPPVLFEAAVWWLPYPAALDRPIAASSWIEDRRGACIGAYADRDGDWSLPLTESQISPHLLTAIVAVEDQRFYQHGGVDWRSAAGAALADVAAGRFRRGGSTLAMQLFRLRDPVRRSILGKLRQAVGALQMERRLSRRQILVDYLNCAPFGGNVVGAGAASWRYFNRPCRDLSLAQAALLAGIPQSPNRFRPDRFAAAARARRDRVLDRMLACGWITPAQRAQAVAEPIGAGWTPLPQDNGDGLAPLLADVASAHPGATLRLSLDASIQHRAAAASARCLQQLSAAHVTAAAVVVLDTSSGACLVAVSLASAGSASARSVDLTRRPHASGSTLKPFIYAAAFDAGLASPGSILQDVPMAWADYQPRDYDRAFMGPISAADALAQSRNLPALLLLSKVGVPRATQAMASMGLVTVARTPDRPGLSLAIGGAAVTPMELADAYAALARGGRGCTEALLDGQLPDASNSLLGPAACLAVLQCLANPSRTAAVCPAAAALAPAWKTGTSSGHRDAWCAAVTPRRTVVVWLGNADGSGAASLVGQESAAPLALQILAQCDPGGAGFAPPAGFDTVPVVAPTAAAPASLAMICPTSGQEIVRDPSVPPDQQRLALRAEEAAGAAAGGASGAAVGRVWWFVDGSSVGESDGAQPLWWPLSPGRHSTTAVAGDGSAAHAEFSVR